MLANTPEHAIELLDEAFNRCDLEAVLSLYEAEAVVAPQPGAEARGMDALRALYSQFMKPGMVATQIQTKVLEAGGIALFLSRWSLSVDGRQPESHVATTVLRQQPDGGWKALIDSACGPELLGQAAEPAGS